MSTIDWLMVRRSTGARDVKSLFNLERIVIHQEPFPQEVPSNLNIEINFDTERLDQLIADIVSTTIRAKDDGKGNLNDFI